MRRRAFIVSATLSAATFPFHADAQKTMPVIGYMSGGSERFYASIVPAFRDGLREIGFVEGQDV